MPPSGDSFFALPEKCGLPHPPESIPSHLQPGAADLDLLQDSAAVSIDASQLGNLIHIAVSITNTGAGHHLPIDHQGRHLKLTVHGENELGQPLTQIAGPHVPKWGGVQAGQPGTACAKVLQDVETGEQPVVSCWRPSSIAADSRIAAGDTSVSNYTFLAHSPGSTVKISTELRFRRLFQSMMDDKGWTAPDIIMEEESVFIDVENWSIYLLPLTINQ